MLQSFSFTLMQSKGRTSLDQMKAECLSYNGLPLTKQYHLWTKFKVQIPICYVDLFITLNSTLTSREITSSRQVSFLTATRPGYVLQSWKNQYIINIYALFEWLWMVHTYTMFVWFDYWQINRDSRGWGGCSVNIWVVGRGRVGEDGNTWVPVED